MRLRRAVRLAIVSMLAVVLHPLMVRAMANGHVAHVLLGAGSSVPPLGPAFLAIALVVVRLFVVVAVPGVLLAASASVVAHLLERLQRGSSSGAGSSVAGGAGTSIGARGTK